MALKDSPDCVSCLNLKKITELDYLDRRPRSVHRPVDQMSHSPLSALNQGGLAPLLPPSENGLAPRITSEKSEAETLPASPLLLSHSEIDLHHWELSKMNNSPHPRPKGTGVLSVLLTSIKGPDPRRTMMVATQIQHRHVLICCARESLNSPQAPLGPPGALFNHFRQQYNRIAQD